MSGSTDCNKFGTRSMTASKINLKTVSTILAFSLLAGCADINSTKLGEGAKEAAAKAKSMAQQKGAAIVVRVSLSGSYCTSGQVILTRIVNGQLSGDTVEIGQFLGDTPADGLKELGKTYVHFLTFNLPAIAKTIDSQDIRTSFRPIAPGSYVVSQALCQIGQQHSASLGSNGASLFSAAPRRPVAVAGDSYISVDSGQIVDAGVLDIHVIQRNNLFMDGKGLLIASVAPTAFREAIRQNLPDLYPNITYTKFGPYRGVLQSTPAKP